PKYIAMGHASKAATIKRVPSETPNARATATPAMIPTIHSHVRAELIGFSSVENQCCSPPLFLLLHLTAHTALHLTAHAALHLLHHAHHVHAWPHVVFH